MAFNKANLQTAQDLLSTVRDTKSYQPPKRKKKRRKTSRAKPGPKVLKRLVPKKQGRPTQVEQMAVEALVLSVSSGETEAQLQQRGKAMGIALRRSPEAIHSMIEDARAKLAGRAVAYVDLQFEGAQVAAAAGDTRPAQWAIEHIAEKAEKGKIKRIVDPVKAEGNTGGGGPTVNIAVALGGIQPGANLVTKAMLPAIDVDVESFDDERDLMP